ncbi:uncharacterized protein LOC135842438 isoform X1 [Planococcus citri]|uniref:uncharacterized protein LOC135842438 isoform X1 n=1 Tax=Planococcus citri TaxID=170843 RepID=UPI0031F8CDFE
MSTNRTHEGIRIVDDSNDPFVYLYNVPNLKELASHEVARGIWCSGLEKFQLDNKQDSSHKERSVQLIADLNIPKCIKGMLRNDLREVGRSIKQWAEHLLFYMKFPKKFSKHRYDIPSIDPNWLVWSTNGEIDCRKTAKNMLQVDCLTNVHKFIIMSAYCMEDEMKNFSLDWLPVDFYANVTRSNGWVFFYWICYLRNELCKVPEYFVMAENFNIRDRFINWISYLRNELCKVPRSLSVAAMNRATAANFKPGSSAMAAQIRVMAANFNIRDRFINDYFWSLLSEDDQVAIAKYWIHRTYKQSRILNGPYCNTTCVFFEQTISKMNYNQQQRLFTESSHISIFFDFTSFSNSPRCALCIWRNIKNHIEVTQFSSIIDSLTFCTSDYPLLMSALAEIWDTATDSQRNYLIHDQSWLCSYIDLCLGNDNPYLREFLSKLLHQLPSNERKRLIFKVARSLFFHECCSEAFNLLVNSCLPHWKDQLALKEFVMQSISFKIYLHDLVIRDQEYEKFIGKIKFYCSYDTNAVQVFKEEFLKTELTAHSTCEIGLITNINKWNKFSEFIDDTFENDPTSRSVVKRKFISKMVASACKNPRNVKTLYDRFDDLVKVVETVFVDEELKKVKRSFFIPYELILFFSFHDYDRSYPYSVFPSGWRRDFTSVTQ